MIPRTVLPLMSLFILAACDTRPQDRGVVTRHAPSPPAVSSSSGDLARRWLGAWSGPEGTSLVIAPAGNAYRVTIRNLDGPRTFRAAIAGERLAFERDGVNESIHAGTGTETGMKWLADKSDCLIVKAGEGYCRE